MKLVLVVRLRNNGRFRQPVEGRHNSRRFRRQVMPDDIPQGTTPIH
jgi:hypothetical protein